MFQQEKRTLYSVNKHGPLFTLKHFWTRALGLLTAFCIRPTLKNNNIKKIDMYAYIQSLALYCKKNMVICKGIIAKYFLHFGSGTGQVKRYLYEGKDLWDYNLLLQ